MNTIYLDNNATTQLLPEVEDAMREAEGAGYANAASQHEPGRRARRVLEDCRERIAEILGARTGGMDADRVVFTSGGTEANNLAVLGLAGAVDGNRAQEQEDADRSWQEDTARSWQLRQRGRIVISAIEHPSVTEAAQWLGEGGWQVDKLGVDRNGQVRVEQLRELIGPDTRLVCVMFGNNETGILQPVREVAAVCREAGVPCHTDAVQGVAKVPVSFQDLGVDTMTCTAHKLHGPLGIGALVVRHGVTIAPQLFGGHQQGGIRPGTECVVLAVGFRAALETWHREGRDRTARLASMRDRLEAAILQGYSDAVVVGRDSPRLPHTSNIGFVGLDRQALQMALDLSGVACSTGSACASGSSEPSPILVAMGGADGVTRGSIRFSLGAGTSPAEVDAAAERILLTCHKLRRQ
jgi:cysteine desulfurase